MTGINWIIMSPLSDVPSKLIFQRQNEELWLIIVAYVSAIYFSPIIHPRYTVRAVSIIHVNWFIQLNISKFTCIYQYFQFSIQKVRGLKQKWERMSRNETTDQRQRNDQRLSAMRVIHSNGHFHNGPFEHRFWCSFAH